MKVVFGIIGLVLLCSAAISNTNNGNENPLDTVAVKYSETISAEDLKTHLSIIASDEYEGRETGKKGQKMAAEYIANHFKNIGIPGAVNGQYFQKIPLMMKKNSGQITVNETSYPFFSEFYFFPGFNSDTLIETSEVVFLGYGIEDDNYNDYEGVDVKGKIVMILDGEPHNKKGKSWITKKKIDSDWNWRSKLKAAKSNGARAVITVVEDFEQKKSRVAYLTRSASLTLDSKSNKEKPNRRLPNFYISEKLASEITGKTEKSIQEIGVEIEKTGKPVHVNYTTNLKLEVDKGGDKISSENVLGFIEGTDLKDEILVISAHYDHIGKDGDKIYNGADDDGSGTVATLELAEAFIKAKNEGNGPRRSVLIMTFSGEEKGLLGSEYYSDNPVFPLKNTVADLNIDMIGRIDEKHEGNQDYVYLIGSDKLSTDLHKISEDANKKYTQLELDYTFNDPDDPNRFYYRSDHYNFAKNNIPVIFYFNGTHEDYHQPTDTVDKINFSKMEKITKLVFFTAWDLANRDERIVVDVENDFED
jgi:hypothetical protein